MNTHEVESMHVDEGVLLALIDGESTEEKDHVDSCDECTRRLEELRFVSRRVTAELEVGDVASPWTEMPESLREAARQAETAVEGVTPIRTARSTGWRTGGRSVAAAAGLILVLAAGAYAVPGSPVRPIMDSAFAAISGIFGGDAGPVDPGPSQVTFDPFDGAVVVSIEGVTDALRVTVRASDATRATVSARDATFNARTGGVVVTDAAGDLTVDLPASASGVVEIDGTPVAQLRDGTVTRLPGAESVSATIVVETAG